MAKFETESGARALLERIQTYWADRGYEVDGHVFAAGYSERLRSTVFEVQTNLVNGLPPRKAAKSRAA